MSNRKKSRRDQKLLEDSLPFSILLETREQILAGNIPSSGYVLKPFLKQDFWLQPILNLNDWVTPQGRNQQTII